MACEACSAKFSLFTRKKQCSDCLRYFCSKCVIKRLDKTLSCDNCSMLSRRPLIRSQLIRMHSKHLRQYLLAKKVSVKGCIEKEDLIELLMIFANDTSDYTEEISGTTFDHHERPEPVILEGGEASEISSTRGSNVSPKVPVWSDFVKLSDINTLSELEYLSVKQLKNLLSTNRVDYKGCIERCELLDRASRLWQERNKELKADGETLDENLCKICWDEPIDCVILECGHVACCLNCGKQMSECPICKQYIVRVVRCFKA